MELKSVVKKIMESNKLKEKLKNLESFDEVYEFFVSNGYEGGKSDLQDKLFKDSASVAVLDDSDLMHIAGGNSGRRVFLACSGLMMLMGLLPSANLSGYTANATATATSTVNEDNSEEMWKAMRNSNLEKVRYFIKQGADVNQGLWCAVRSFDNLDLVKCFVENGADVNIKWLSGWTLLHCSQNKQVIDYLISHGADVNGKNDSGQTPLHWACSGKNIEWAKYLLERGADANIGDNYGNVPLRYLVKDAARYEQGFDDVVAKDTMKMIDLLIENGANVDAKDIHGETPLYVAALYGGIDVFKYLIEHGADINIKNNDGKSVHQVVSEYLHEHRRLGNGEEIYESLQKMLKYIDSKSEWAQLR